MPDKKCPCASCIEPGTQVTWMILCAKCGNKRCPHATDHRNECTHSNEPGQQGSWYDLRSITDNADPDVEKIWKEDSGYRSMHGPLELATHTINPDWIFSPGQLGDALLCKESIEIILQEEFDRSFDMTNQDSVCRDDSLGSSSPVAFRDDACVLTDEDMDLLERLCHAPKGTPGVYSGGAKRVPIRQSKNDEPEPWQCDAVMNLCGLKNLDKIVGHPMAKGKE